MAQKWIPVVVLAFVLGVVVGAMIWGGGSQPHAAAGGAPKPTGRWTIVHTDPEWKHGYGFEGDTARRLDAAGIPNGDDYAMEKRGDDWIILAGDRIERVTICGDVIFVEHFYPASAYPHESPAVTGRGEPWRS